MSENNKIRQPNYISHEKGFMSWWMTVDHKRLGLLYSASIFTFFLIGGVCALLVRTELISAGKTIMGPDDYNVAFTLHGAIMIFLFIVPGIPATLGNFMLPLMI